MNVRDNLILRKIVGYCERIENYTGSCNEDVFTSNAMLQDACCMCIVQIGELSAQLSDEEKASITNVPWRVVKDTRNFYVHNYGSIDVLSVWETIQTDIPMLKKACTAALESQ